MRETRSGKWGRNAARVVNYIISTLPKSYRKSFRRKFIQEVKKYQVCRELDEIDEINPKNPRELAKWYKRGNAFNVSRTDIKKSFEFFIRTYLITFLY